MSRTNYDRRDEATPAFSPPPATTIDNIIPARPAATIIPVEPADSEDVRQFTMRAIGVGILVGTVVNFSNMYFGLQTGWVSMMSMPSALMGFAMFKSAAKHLRFPFTPVENVLVQTVAVAVGSMPLSVGYVGVIPALERLLKPEEGGPIFVSMPKLVLWGIGVAFFGVFFAVPLRRQVLIREKLKFPSGTATALMISVLHNADKKPQTEAEEGLAEGPDAPQESNWRKKTRLLLYSFAVSGGYTLVSFFFPIIRDLPVFGTAAASTWLWTLNPSPAYIGQGIIMGPETTMHMLFGAFIGWAILSPLAKHKNWAPGDVGDWKSGSRGWIVWISLAIMLTDSLISLGSVLLDYAVQHGLIPRPVQSHSGRGDYQALAHSDDDERPRSSSGLLNPTVKPDGEEEDAPPHHLVPNKAVFIGLFLSGLLCIAATAIVFPFVPLYATLAAFLLALLLSIMGVRALGQTDLNPVSGISKLTQLIFAVIVPRSNPAAVAINLVAGAISEAGAQQAGDIMQDLKAGHLLRASPKAQFYGQLIGSVVGAVVSAVVYRIYAAVYPIPGTLFQVPTSFVWIDCSRLVYGHGLPPAARMFAIIFAGIFASSTVYRIVAGKKGLPMWWVPGGVAVAVGMYNVPSFTLARAVGGGVQWWWSRKGRSGDGDTVLVIVASGLILGEGLVSVVNLVMENAGVPHL